MTVDPVTYKPKYEYRASWVINPGCDFERYDIYLTCAGRKQLDQYPNSINCGAVGAPSIGYTVPMGKSAGYSQCDCINLPDEKVGELVHSGSLQQNVLEDGKSFHRVIDSDVRYDHLKFVLRTDRRITPSMKPNCFPSGYDDGVFYFPIIDKTARDIADCTVQPLSGVITCGGGTGFFDTKGTANFIDLRVNGIDSFKKQDMVFYVGDNLFIDSTIRKVGKDKCAIVTLDGESKVWGIAQSGTQQYQFLWQESLDIGTKQKSAQSLGLNVNVINSPPSQNVIINVGFYDIDNSGKIEFDNDLIEVNGERFESAKISPEGTVAGTAKVSYENYKVIVEKESAKIEIMSALLVGGIDGQIPKKQITIAGNNKEVQYVSSPITVFGAQKTNLQSQTKSLTIGLYHIKDDKEVYSGPDSCSENDPVVYEGAQQKRDIKIIVKQKPVEGSQQASGQAQSVVTIINSNVIPPEVKGTSNVFISVDITGNAKDKPVKLSCQKPDGQNTESYNMNQNGDKYTFNILGSTFIKTAGKYKCTITAEGADAKATQAASSIEFEVMCGELLNYGYCKYSCDENNKIDYPELKCASSLSPSTFNPVCCKT